MHCYSTRQCTLLKLLIFWLAPSRLVNGYPSGAGSCNVGGPAVGGPHIQDSATTGTLSAESGYLVLMGDDIILQPGVTVDVPVQEPSSLRITAMMPSDYFKGFAIIMGGTSDDGAEAGTFTILDRTISQEISTCPDTVQSLTHRDSTAKEGVAVIVELFDEAADSSDPIRVDITLVLENSGTTSNYRYSEFYLNPVRSSTTTSTTTGQTSSGQQVNTTTSTSETTTTTTSTDTSSGNSTAVTTSSNNDGGNGKTCLMIYNMADNPIQDYIRQNYLELLEAPVIGSPNLQTWLYFDFYNQGDDNILPGLIDENGNAADTFSFTGSRYITYDATLQAFRVNVTLQREQNSDSQDIVQAFFEHALTNCLAEGYDSLMAVFPSQGGGFAGFGGDDNMRRRRRKLLSTNENLANALKEALQGVGLQKLDVIAFDASLMQGLGAADDYHEVADYILASESVMPGHGFAYNSLTKAGNALEMAEEMLTTYLDQTQGGASYHQNPKTMSIVENAKFSAFVGEWETLSQELLKALQAGDSTLYAFVSRAHASAVAFESIVDAVGAKSPSAIDIGSWLNELEELCNPTRPFSNASAVYNDMFVARGVGPGTQAGTGMHVTFPNQAEYRGNTALWNQILFDNQNYVTQIAPAFREFLQWYLSSAPPGGDGSQVSVCSQDAFPSSTENVDPDALIIRDSGAKNVETGRFDVAAEISPAVSEVVVEYGIDLSTALVPILIEKGYTPQDDEYLYLHGGDAPGVYDGANFSASWDQNFYFLNSHTFPDRSVQELVYVFNQGDGAMKVNVMYFPPENREDVANMLFLEYLFFDFDYWVDQGARFGFLAFHASAPKNLTLFVSNDDGIFSEQPRSTGALLVPLVYVDAIVQERKLGILPGGLNQTVLEWRPDIEYEIVTEPPDRILDYFIPSADAVFVDVSALNHGDIRGETDTRHYDLTSATDANKTNDSQPIGGVNTTDSNATITATVNTTAAGTPKNQTVVSPNTTGASSSQCPEPYKEILCPAVFSPVECGDNRCMYSNDCVASAAGFDSCNLVSIGNGNSTSESNTTATNNTLTEDDAPVACPKPASDVTCTTEFLPVECGGTMCIYDNQCLATAAGFEECNMAAINATTSTTAPSDTQPGSVAAAGSVWKIINSTADLNLFRGGLSEVNLDKLLSDISINYTVFAPINSAVEDNQLIQYYTDNINSWNGHLTNILENHIIQQSSLTSQQLFGGSVGDSLATLAGEPVAIDVANGLVGGHTIVTADNSAVNGVVHVLGGVLSSKRQSLNLVELLESGLDLSATVQRRLQEENFSLFLELLLSTDLIEDGVLVERSTEGTTLLAPVEIALEENMDSTDLLLYHILPYNLYRDNINMGTQRLISTRHPSGAQIWVTADQNGVVRFNDMIQQREFLASNGVLQVVEKALQPPSIADLVGYSDAHTNLSISIVNRFINASGWGGNQTLFEGDVTLLAPVDDFWSGVNQADQARLVSPLWLFHLQDVMGHMLLRGSYTAAELSGTFATMAGTEKTLETPFSVSDSMQATNGPIHLVGSFDLPPSMTESVYNLLENNATTSGLASLVAAASLSDTLTNLSPVTFFAARDQQWADTVPQSEMTDFLMNHIFEGLYYAEQLKEMDGQVITSLNSKKWAVSVLGGSVFLQAESAGAAIEVSVVEAPTNVLARNGLLYSIDRPLSDGIFATDPPVESPNCTACAGEIIASNALPDGQLCGDWLAVAGQAAIGSEDCLLERAAGVKYCGCSAPEEAGQCDICDSKVLDASIDLPDARGLTCASLDGMLAVDGQATCDVLRSKYSALCQCPGAQDPVCPLCANGDYADKPFPLPTDLSDPEPKVFGDVSDLGCEGLAGLYSVQTAASCSEMGSNLFGNSPFDLRAWCECPGVPQPPVCDNFCPGGAVIPDERLESVPDAELGLTCSELEARAKFLSEIDVCQTFSLLSDGCCEAPMSVQPTSGPSNATTPTSVLVEASFLIYNTEGLTSVDLSQPENAEVLNQAFKEFVNNLIADVEGNGVNGTMPQRHLERTRWWIRRLEVELQPDSATIYSVQDVDCPPEEDPPLPESANCQNVFGRYGLEVKDENPELVQAKYDNETQVALGEGKLQESLNATADPDFPFIVIGPPPEAPTSVPTLSPTFMGNASSPTIVPVNSSAPTPGPTTKPPLRPPPTPVPAADNQTSPIPTMAPANMTTPQPTPMPTAGPTIAPTVVQVNTTFLIYNTDGLTSGPVSQPENAVVLSRAFRDFVTNLVSDVEGTNETQAQRRLRGSRRLDVALRSNSPTLYGVRDVACPAKQDPPLPDKANCQTVYGQYELAVTDENPGAVQKKYVNETEQAIKNGKLQESLDSVAPPGFPFTVYGPGVSPTPPPPAEEDKKMEWWLILIIVLSAVLGLCWIGGILAYYLFRPRKQPEELEPEPSGKLLDEETPAPEAPPVQPSTVAHENFDETDSEDEDEDQYDDEDDDEDDDYFEGDTDDDDEMEARNVSGLNSDYWKEQESTVNIQAEDFSSDEESSKEESEPEWEDEDDEEDRAEAPPTPLSLYSMPATVVPESSPAGADDNDDDDVENLEARSYWDETDSKEDGWLGDDATAQVEESVAGVEDVEFLDEDSDDDGMALGNRSMPNTRASYRTNGYGEDPPVSSQNLDPPVDQYGRDPSVVKPVGDDPSTEGLYGNAGASFLSHQREDPSAAGFAREDPSAVGILKEDPSVAAGEDPSVAAVAFSPRHGESVPEEDWEDESDGSDEEASMPNPESDMVNSGGEAALNIGSPYEDDNAIWHDNEDKEDEQQMVPFSSSRQLNLSMDTPSEEDREGWEDEEDSMDSPTRPIRPTSAAAARPDPTRTFHELDDDDDDGAIAGEHWEDETDDNLGNNNESTSGRA